MATQIVFALSSSTAQFGSVLSGDTITGGASLVDAHRILVAAPVGAVAESQISDSVSGGVLSIAATLTANRTLTTPDASLTVAGQNYANIFTSAQNVRNASGLTVTQAATQDGIALIGRAGGTSSYILSLTPTTLTASRTATFPDASITVAGINLAQTWTATQTFAAISATTGSFSGQITSTLATGTAPLVIASTTLVANLYAARAALADTVTTNANLTGPITSVGNATSVASQTGTGSTFVMDTSPTLVTPILGVATATSLTVLAAATQDAVALAGRAGGTSSYIATLKPTTLTASRTLTLPDGDTTIAGLDLVQTWTAAQTFAAITASSVTNSALTTGRAALIGTAGVMQDSAVFTYSIGSQEFRIGDGTAAPAYVINGASAQNRAVAFRTNNSQRWQIIAGGAAETGVGNAGTSFNITAYDDAGTAIDTPISIVRASGGTITIARPISSNSQITGSNMSTTGSAGFSATGGSTAYNASGSCKVNRVGGTIGTAGDMLFQSDAVGARDFLFAAGSTPAVIATIGAPVAAGTTPGFSLASTSTITGGVTDGYTSGLRIAPTYSAGSALTVTRYNYIDAKNVTLSGAGPAALTDACLVRFDAAAGTHKAVDSSSTKTTPGGVDAWVKININGTLYYMPAYTSKTA
jgi:hypothetical protein